MKSFLKLAISFFVLCLIVFSFAYLFGTGRKQVFREPASHESPVGQLKETGTFDNPGQPADSK